MPRNSVHAPMPMYTIGLHGCTASTQDYKSPPYIHNALAIAVLKAFGNTTMHGLPRLTAARSTAKPALAVLPLAQPLVSQIRECLKQGASYALPTQAHSQAHPAAWHAAVATSFMPGTQ
jgi:hypothetical protein